MAPGTFQSGLGEQGYHQQKQGVRQQHQSEEDFVVQVEQDQVGLLDSEEVQGQLVLEKDQGVVGLGS